MTNELTFSSVHRNGFNTNVVISDMILSPLPLWEISMNASQGQGEGDVNLFFAFVLGSKIYGLSGSPNSNITQKANTFEFFLDIAI